MPKRFYVIVVVLLLLLNVSAVAAQDRTVVWERWDTHIDKIDTTNNQFNVTETFELTFTGQFQVGIRDIPIQYVEDIRNVQVYEDGELLDRGCSERAGTYCVTTSNDYVSVEYYFTRPISNRTETFSIEYTVIGAMRIYDTGDLLGWNVVPADHFGFEVRSSTITVDMPDGYTPREGTDPIETYGTPAEISVLGSTITASTTQSLGTSGEFQIGIQYPHDPNARVPGWQAAYDQQQAYDEGVKPFVDLGLLGLSLLIALGGPLLIYLQWYSRGRDPKIGIVPEYLSEPPSTIRPAVVGTLVDERADLRDVLSTIIDLAHRGYLVMEESHQEGFLGIGSSSKFTFKRSDKSTSDLLPFEANLMSRLFPGGAMERTLDSLQNTFYQYIPMLQNDLYSQLVTEGFFTISPNVTRNTWMGVGGLILAIPIVITFLLLYSETAVPAAAVLALIALGFTGIVALAVANVMPAKTRKGAEEAAKWKAFYRYMDNLEKYTSVEEAAARFEEYLPYAVAFGLNNEWMRRFSRLDNMPVPVWYYPTYMGGPYSGGYRPGTPLRRIGGYQGGSPIDLGGGSGGQVSLDNMSQNMSRGLQSMSDGLTNMLNSASRVMTSRPQQSSASGRWGSGGRSFGGGGFRGGGFSGGGRAGFR
ncbi:MAG: DUF2207 domain-containing protein [Anaerolineae bacterium]